jgi:3'(2'), 5'-bisphosphate nucleotidase
MHQRCIGHLQLDLLQEYQYCWIVDPLDGTKEFIKRVPHFTVNIALVKGGSPVMGVVCTPAAATMHFAVKGQGAFVRCAYYVVAYLCHWCITVL